MENAERLALIDQALKGAQAAQRALKKLYDDGMPVDAQIIAIQPVTERLTHYRREFELAAQADGKRAAAAKEAAREPQKETPPPAA